MPEVASVPLTFSATAWLYQPFASGGRASTAVTAGGVESYWSESEAPAELPALSVQLPPTVVPLVSGPLYVVDVHESIPEVASEPVNAIATAWLYQPFASGPRAGAAVTLGGVASYLIVSDDASLTLPATSRQVPPTDAPPLSGPP